MTYRFYNELAEWWPLLSPPGEYEQEAAFVADLLEESAGPAREVLELGSGGGHVAHHLGAAGFAMTLVDLSEGMVTVSRALNPGVPHHLGDMRSVRLGRTFDAVLVHDAVDYMTTEESLGQAIATAFDHCRPGGVAVFVPDWVAETFEPGTDSGGSDADDGRGARFLEWSWDPDPADSTVASAYAFLLRRADGTVETAAETHTLGLFSQAEWLNLMSSAGFTPWMVVETTTEDRSPRRVFLGRRPDPSLPQ